MLEIQNISVSYGTIRALQGISLQILEGEIVSVLGPNGAGKSTLINTISGLVRHDQGHIRFEGSPIDQLSAVRRVRRGIVQCPEGRRLFGTLTVGENLRLGASRRGVSWRKVATDLDWLMGLFPILRDRWTQQTRMLSGGEQQMVALARSIIAQPRLLLLDEPALGLAPRVVQQVFDALPLISKRRIPILLVEQSAYAALQISVRGLLLRAGSVALAGPPDKLRAYLNSAPSIWGAPIKSKLPGGSSEQNS